MKTWERTFTVSMGVPFLTMVSSDSRPRSSMVLTVFSDSSLSCRRARRLSMKIVSDWLVMWHMYCRHVRSGPGGESVLVISWTQLTVLMQDGLRVGVEQSQPYQAADTLGVALRMGQVRVGGCWLVN